MCVNPARLPDGTEFGCRKCWQCRENKIQDWVGRCIAQSKTSTHTYAITLTYGGGDHERAAVLTYSDVQKYFKRLRKAGFKFKYLVAGEYGSRKGRAHWHCILFFVGPAPKHKIRENFQDPFWGHGHSFWDEPSAKALRYVCKYVRKDDGDEEAQAHFAMSKKPPIGSEYFAEMAQRYVEDGISPPDLNYRFAENRDKDGKPVQHYMHGATARDFLDEFIRSWKRRYGNDRWPNSELVEQHQDKSAGYAPDPVLEPRRTAPYPDWKPFRDSKLEFSEPHNLFFTRQNGQRYWFRPIKGQKKEEWAWHGEANQLIRHDQSEAYRDLIRSSEQRKLQQDRMRQDTIARTQSERASFKDRGRIPMVGDGHQWHKPER